jgi:hypothetical protein
MLPFIVSWPAALTEDGRRMKGKGRTPSVKTINTHTLNIKLCLCGIVFAPHLHKQLVLVTTSVSTEVIFLPKLQPAGTKLNSEPALGSKEVTLCKKVFLNGEIACLRHAAPLLIFLPRCGPDGAKQLPASIPLTKRH